jgi:hypothetical protein
MYSARNYTEIVKAYNLEILERPADWSIENGDLARTTDGDIKNGDDVYSALSRLVQLWCYNETHFRYLFDAAREMVEQHSLLADEIDDIGNIHAREAAANPLVNIDEFAQALHAHSDKEGVAYFGANTYAGCLVIALGNALQRFKRDLKIGKTWGTAAPTFGRHSVGAIVIGAANGYRHENEWETRMASFGSLDQRQKASHDIITEALAGNSTSEISGMARTPEIVQLLSNGSFETLARNIFEFAKNVARIGK